MNSILVSYDLIAPGKDYGPLHEAIKKFGPWWHCLESVWIIKTDLSASEVRDSLKPYIDGNDRLVAVELGGSWASLHLSENCVEWLRRHLSRS